VAQVVEHLPTKCEALSSNPSIATKINKQKRIIIKNKLKVGKAGPVAHACNLTYLEG
jgi:hypothetical protein